jgi:hypothetical protein
LSLSGGGSTFLALGQGLCWSNPQSSGVIGLISCQYLHLAKPEDIRLKSALKRGRGTLLISEKSPQEKLILVSICQFMEDLFV